MKDITIKSVADHAGVSIGTVSNVLNYPHRVAPKTRIKVEAAIRELGFVRHGSAASLRAGRGSVIGVSVIDMSNPFFTEIAAGVEEACSDRGHAVLLGNTDDDPAKQERNLTVLAEQRVKGVLITPLTGTIGQLELLHQRRINTVLVDHPAVRDDQCSVSVDDVVGGAMALRHLLDLGARRILCVTGPLGIRQCRDRLRGARNAVAQAGTDPAPVLAEMVVPAMKASYGLRLAEELLASGPLPEAIFCGNDLLAIGLMSGLRDKGVRFPDDVALIGYDDIDTAAAVLLSSIRQPARKLGRIAAELLLEECDAPTAHAHRQVRFQPDLVVRESTRR